MRSLITITLAILVCLPLTSRAENKNTNELPKSGSLATSSMAGLGKNNVPGAWGQADPLKGETAPISGSVSKLSNTQWVMKLFNNSKDSYSVSVEVVQFGKNGNKLKSDHFSFSLAPGAKQERNVSTSESTAQCSLNIVNWSKRGGAAKSAPASAIKAVPAQGKVAVK